MAARKNRPIQYEVASRARRTSQRTPVPPSGAPTDSTPPVRDEGLDEEAGRPTPTFGMPHLAVAAAVVLVIAFAVYKIGQRTTQPEPEGPSELELVLADKPPDAAEETARPAFVPDHRGAEGDVAVAPRRASGPRSAINQPDPAPTAEPTEPQALESGYYYALVQYFPPSKRGDADAARDFLRSRGVECIVRQGQGDWQLIATDQFSSAAAAGDLLRRIREHGREYSRIGGYDFAGCQARKL